MEVSPNSGVERTNRSDVCDPRVGFLYKAMLQRAPGKRRVKPVPNSRVQVNFDGLDDSEEDSDFDINKHSQGDQESSAEESDDIDSENDDDDESGNDSDEEDDDETDDKYEGIENRQRQSIRIGSSDNLSDNCGDNDEDDDDCDGNERESSEADNEGDEMEELNSEDDEEDDSEDDSGNDHSESPEIKGLGHAWNMIDTDEDDEDYVPRKRKKKSAKTGSSSEVLPKAKSKKSKTDQPSTDLPKDNFVGQQQQQQLAPQDRIKVLVCCVCLSDRSADDDEIVECDNCGVSVHEGCYGISESHSTASTESSASTEPWFCDACKANVKPMCELCPNTGGIFKETDNGKWVHIVCALYTPGVAFGDVDKLSLVTLFEMPYSKWGAKECCLCEDSRFSQTGVCISCDAGMCKAYFHVTCNVDKSFKYERQKIACCAQREGLLTEAAPEEVMDIADPFFAYCKLHADKITSKVKRRNWLAIQSHVKTHTPSLIDDEEEKLRFIRKLNRHREKYSAAKLKRPPSWVPTQKMIRHLHTSPSAVHGFLRKAELMGIITQAQTVPAEKVEVRKAALGQPAFTAEFINYFLDRNIKVDNLKINLLDLSSQNKKLQAQEKVVRSQYDQFHTEATDLKQQGGIIKREIESLYGMLQDIYGKPLPNIPEVFKSRKRTRSPSKKESATPPATLINQCGVCHKTTEQHLLAKCDRCNKHYHLGCLEPPLTRMPKKTKLFGWQCSYCVLSSSDGSVKSAFDVDEPRKLRETIREPDKFFHLSHIQDSLKMQQKKSLLNKKSKQRREAAKARRVGSLRNLSKSVSRPAKCATVKSRSLKFQSFSKTSIKKASSDDSGSHLQTSASSSSSSSSSRAVQSVTAAAEDSSAVLEIMCVVCNKFGCMGDTVRCDECMLFYHLICLDPPMKKSPKVRGYAWHCEACDMLDNSLNWSVDSK